MSFRKVKSAFVPDFEKGCPKILRTLGYKLGKTLGKGTYSKVCVAVDKNGNRFACKIINKKIAGHEFIKKFLPRELQIITSIRHKNIVSVSKILEINDTIYMFMDYCRNGDLLEYIRNNGSFSEEESKPILRQIVSAIQYLHDRDIAHRDLKCENVLLMWNNEVKLADFGFARKCKDEHGMKIFSNTFCGSAAYAAPEILQGISYDPKMYDIWALGCILYIMLMATMPFDDSNIKKMLKIQMNRSVSTTAAAHWIKNNDLKILLCNLLEPDVRLRPQISDIANSKWIQEEERKRTPKETVYETILF